MPCRCAPLHNLKIMREIFLAIFLLFTFVVHSQTESIKLPEKDGIINYEEIISVDSALKDELYKRAKLWVINSFKNEKNGTSTSDKELGEIKGTGLFTILKDQNVLFSFRISIKDFKYKYIFYDFIYLDNNGNKTKTDLQYYYDYYKSGKKLGRGMMTKYVKESKNKIDFLISSINASMTKQETDW
jgi:hypothetical protein